ncbi:SH3 domain-containing protein [Maritimibacter fusiformis]|uniref:SH3 domain-containing protein n=1 Tax=Maritimibacter fusiformis TaxID=2603819 RepID=A0A5D0RGK2_9RHOB|nr:SH3 domain-containing protein [Maritimibacter fusiformis]TYB80076.1 SH3 domain-containing protein [Maritimibacter fusiformis]
MGILRLILITLVGIWAAMLYFGRDEGLPETVIGRTPAPEPEVVAPDATLDPGENGEVIAAPDTVPEPEPEPDPPPPADPEVAETPAPPPATEPEPDPEPEPEIASDPPPAAEPEVVAEPEPEPAPDPEPEPAPEPTETVLYVTGTKVNVRTGPATVYEVITSLEQGAEVVDLGDAGEGWRLIRLGAGEIGYMSGDFLSPVAP